MQLITPAQPATLSDTGSIVRLKIVDIGDWDMTGGSSTGVSTGLPMASIRHVSAIVRNDAADTFVDLVSGRARDVVQGYITPVDNTVGLTSTLGGTFDTAGYDGLGYNRGWVFIWYIA